MVYGNFKCYNFHFNNYVGSSILIKDGENRTTFMIGETICLVCVTQTSSVAWEIPSFIGASDLVVSSGFPEGLKKGFTASLKDGNSTLSFVISKKMNQLQVLQCRDGFVGGFPLIRIIDNYPNKR